MTQVFVRRAAPGRQAEIDAAVEQLFAQLPAAVRLGPHSRVLVKPNLLRKSTPAAAVTTHPDVLRAVLRAVARRGVRQVTVADSPGGPYTPAVMDAVYRGCGLQVVCQEEGAALYTRCHSAPHKTEGRVVRTFTLMEPVHQCDFIINLPKMKTHVLTTLSGAVKNLFGCVPGLQKAEFHTRFPQKEHFADMLVDLCQAVSADMHLVDGLLAMEGDGPGSGTPRACGLLVAGEDPYLVDLLLCGIMGLAPMQVPTLAAAHRRGLCPATLPPGALANGRVQDWAVTDYRPPRSYSGRLDFSSHVPVPLRPVVSAVARAVAPRPVVRAGRCIGCGKCVQICPQKTMELRKNKAYILYKDCIKCFCCHEICPVHAVDVRRLGLFGH